MYNTEYTWEDNYNGSVVDVEVFVMHDEIRNLHLTANLPKYENMDKVLEIIEYAACVKFEVKGRTVVVRRD